MKTLSKFIENITSEQAAKLVDIMTQFRLEQEKKMKKQYVRYEKT